MLFPLASTLKAFRRAQGFAATAVVTLGIGMGSSTAVFSVVDLLLFRSLPYPRAEQLVSVGFSGPIDSVEFHIGGSYLDWKDRQTAFSAMTSMYPGILCDVAGDPPVRVACQNVEANFLHTLGVAPVFGRDFRTEDDVPGAPLVALLGNAFWRSRFRSDERVVNRIIEIDGGLVRVVGVLPASFEMPQLGECDVMLTERMNHKAAQSPNSTIFLRAFARLSDGVSIESARQRLLPLFHASVDKDVPPPLRKEVGLVVRSLRDRQVREARTASWLLFGAVLSLFGLACANVSNLMLARTAARRGEFAVRAALGASRVQLLRQLLAESLVLSLAGCAAGCAVAKFLVRAFVAISPEGIIRLNQARLDGRVVAFALFVSLASALLTALAPAWDRLSVDALATWRTAGSVRMRSRQVLVAMQVALSMVLLSGASLLVRSLWKLESAPLGFEPQRVMTATFELNREKYRQPEKQQAFYTALEQQLAHIPGVNRFSLSDSIPPAGGAHGRPFSNIRVFGHAALPEGGGMVTFRYITPGYFRTLGIPLLAGSDFTESERASGDTPVILSVSLARKIFGSEDPIGQRIDLEMNGHWLPIVGVVGDVKNSGLAQEAAPEYYRLRTYQLASLGLFGVALLETELDHNTAARWVRQSIAEIDPDLPVNIVSMQQRVSRLTARQRFLAVLLGLFAGFGLLLAAVGLYGVLSFLVTQRTREIGVRMAMGATPGNIAALVERQAGLWVACGVVAGLTASLALGRVVSSVLFKVSPDDGWSLSASVAMLALVASLAAWVPARRAAMIDPAASLRAE